MSRPESKSPVSSRVVLKYLRHLFPEELKIKSMQLTLTIRKPVSIIIEYYPDEDFMESIGEILTAEYELVEKEPMQKFLEKWGVADRGHDE